jgi:hypothetical protein
VTSFDAFPNAGTDASHNGLEKPLTLRLSI